MSLLFKLLLGFLVLFSYSCAVDTKAEESEEDIRCLAKNIYFEARSESMAGWLGVAYVTLNRVSSKRFPNSVCEVVFQGPKYENSSLPVRHKCQFSWYCDGKSDHIVDLDIYSEISYFVRTIVKDTSRFDITEGATHYHHYKISPFWAESMTKVVRIDSHIFYRN